MNCQLKVRRSAKRSDYMAGKPSRLRTTCAARDYGRAFGLWYGDGVPLRCRLKAEQRTCCSVYVVPPLGGSGMAAEPALRTRLQAQERETELPTLNTERPTPARNATHRRCRRVEVGRSLGSGIAAEPALSRGFVPKERFSS